MVFTKDTTKKETSQLNKPSDLTSTERDREKKKRRVCVVVGGDGEIEILRLGSCYKWWWFRNVVEYSGDGAPLDEVSQWEFL